MKKIIREKLRESLNIKKDIIITLPKSVKWVEYEKELDKVKGGEEIINFKVNNFPKINVGCKCYLVHDGFIRGWMEVVGLSEKEFTCSTTGKKWVGKFIERSGPFHNIDPILMKGFQGFRYY